MFEDTENDAETGICDDCGHECTAKKIDFGIGPYEYGSVKGFHHDYQYASPCCEAAVLLGGEVVLRRAVHVARFNHKDGKIKIGDKYSLTVRRSWRKDGPSWVHTQKKLIERPKS